ncbi:MAG: STAS domain-containing protein [Leptospiraceae bacterium]|nr:STAS domain-containing protein [Leptospiraceae bacterium]MCK6380060.1 STAS domain-containing protein [Leptospiraceae bacterium]NUM40653.1 STAS domain-containing protein [Leptospiraceae bacterium]
MDIKLRKAGNVSIIDLSGSLDIYTSTDFKSFIEKNINSENNRVIINIEKMTYIDSSGIGMLIKELNFVQTLNGDFKIANMKTPIEKVFKVAGLTSYFQIISEEEYKQISG